MIVQNKYKIFLVLTPIFLLFGCASSPSGQSILMDQVKNETSMRSKTSETIKQGRPIFIKAYAYPQLLSGGDILGGGTVFIDAGREKLDINKVVFGEK